MHFTSLVSTEGTRGSKRVQATKNSSRYYLCSWVANQPELPFVLMRKFREVSDFRKLSETNGFFELNKANLLFDRPYFEANILEEVILLGDPSLETKMLFVDMIG